MKYIQIQTTFEEYEKAVKMGKLLLDAKLVADAQVSEINSLFNFEDKFYDRREWLLTAKTRKTLYRDAEKFIRENHSFKVPQIVATEFKSALKEYSDWIKENTVKEKK